MTRLFGWIIGTWLCDVNVEAHKRFFVASKINHARQRARYAGLVPAVVVTKTPRTTWVNS